MEKDDLLNDAFLRKLVQREDLENPSGDFVEKIMEKIQQQPQTVLVKKPFYLYMKSYSGYIALAAFVLLVILTSDIPFFNFIPGKQYLTGTFLPYFDSVISPLKSLFGSAKTITIPLMIVVSAGLFFIIDQLISRKAAV